jgi:hypothetical protein
LAYSSLSTQKLRVELFFQVVDGATLQEYSSSAAGAACITAGSYKTEKTILIPFYMN